MFYILPRLYNRKIALYSFGFKKKIYSNIYINDSRLGLKVSLNNNNDTAKMWSFKVASLKELKRIYIY